MTIIPYSIAEISLQILLNTLRRKPLALEHFFLSLITMTDQADVLIDFSDLIDFHLPKVTPRGNANFSLAADLVLKRINQLDSDLKSRDKHGISKVFVVSQGYFSDWDSSLVEQLRPQTFSFAPDREADIDVLEKISHPRWMLQLYKNLYAIAEAAIPWSCDVTGPNRWLHEDTILLSEDCHLSYLPSPPVKIIP